MISTIRNPIIPGFHPDPSICRVGDDYYLAVSSFEYFPGVPLFHSRDLVHWEKIGHALTRKSQLDLTGATCSGGIFAPTLRYSKGRFYIVTTNVKTGGGNFMVWTDDIRSEWSDPIWIDKEWFDPSLLFDDDGKIYYTRRNEHAIVQSLINVDTGELEAEPREISLPYISCDGEGPHLYKINGVYYLLTAEGGTGYGHMICIGRSDSPWGPFEPCPCNPILSHASHTSLPIRYTGHGDLFQSANGSWWIVFLGTRHKPGNGSVFHHLGRETFLAPVVWQDGWPVVNDGKIVSLEMKVSGLPEPHFFESKAAVDSFDMPNLDIEWTFLRNVETGIWSLTDRSGWLRLFGNAHSLDDMASPAFLGRRLIAPYFEAETLLEFSPLQSGEEAGMTLLLSNEFHAEIALRRRADTRMEWLVRRRIGDLQKVVWRQPAPTGAGRLGISGDWNCITFSFGTTDTGNLDPVASAQRKFFCTEIGEGWTGCFLGLYASGNGKPCTSTADFKYFKLETAHDFDPDL